MGTGHPLHPHQRGPLTMQFSLLEMRVQANKKRSKWFSCAFCSDLVFMLDQTLVHESETCLVQNISTTHAQSIRYCTLHHKDIFLYQAQLQQNIRVYQHHGYAISFDRMLVIELLKCQVSYPKQSALLLSIKFEIYGHFCLK